MTRGRAGWDGPIIDAHQHFWEPQVNHHPWLAPDARIPFRYGDYQALKRPYLPADYRRDAAGCAVVQTVYVETEWDPSDPVGETRYATALAAREGWPNAIVAQAWLDREDVAAVLAAQAAFPLVRSVRHKPHRPAGAATLMSDAAWRHGFGLLAGHGLHFDLQTPWQTLGEAAELARDFPATTIILNHAGLPGDRGAGALAGWRAAMARFAACPNTAVKVSGLGQPGQPWTIAENEGVVRTTLDLFGAGHCMFGSNYPVDSLCAGFGTILNGLRTILAPLPDADQAAFFFGTAQRIYRPAVPAAAHTITTEGKPG